MSDPAVTRSTRLRARGFVDYSLQRRAALQSLRTGRASSTDICDAHPDLLRAATHHGEPIPRTCAVCRKPALRLLRYVYSGELGQFSGRLRSAAEVVAMSTQYADLRVYVVEVCSHCHWNHLTASYVVGDEGQARTPPRRQRTVEDDWG